MEDPLPAVKQRAGRLTAPPAGSCVQRRWQTRFQKQTFGESPRFSAVPTPALPGSGSWGRPILRASQPAFAGSPRGNEESSVGFSTHPCGANDRRRGPAVSSSLH